ncbi:cytochrome protein [Truncatella angustata]|uniref:Cytochrome protein n=1 Tax=Truncatella angustata TaxID=152316 RepID=A0A9P9A2N5_9PEZI|nr:cytochrome protein [Truncatella angustata]KAH6660901.1 cytochrome protein [Truncatella angustata]
MVESNLQHLVAPTAALLLAIIGWVYTVFTSPMGKLPGPLITKFTDIPLRWYTITGQRPRWVHLLHEKYGPIVRVSPYESSVQDVAATQQMYRTKGEFLKSNFYDHIGVGVVSVFTTRSVDIHRRQRRLLSGEISESGLNKHIPVVESKIRLTIERMREEMQQRHTTDIFHWFLSMATDVIGELSFGESFRMLESGEETQYMRDLKAVAKSSGVRAAFPFLYRLSHYIKLPLFNAAVQGRQRTTQYADESLQRHHKVVEEQGGEAKPTLFSKLYNNTSVGELTSKELRDNAMSYIIAGSDTTANTLTYLVWMVCRHSQIKNELLRELRTVPEGFEYSDIKSLPYLNRIIEESLRLYPAAPSGLPRVVPAGGVQFSGHYLPAGSTVAAQAWSMHRLPNIFPEPLKFDPSRWESPTKAMKDAFVPFGGGSRVCLGLHLARMELRLATARFFTAFPNARISSLEGFKDEDMEPEMYFLLTPKTHRCLLEVS